jgi:hypothetical protein
MKIAKGRINLKVSRMYDPVAIVNNKYKQNSMPIIVTESNGKTRDL